MRNWRQALVSGWLVWGAACGPQVLHPVDAGSSDPAVCNLGATVVYHGGPVLDAVEVSTLYWDGAVADLQPQIDAFFGAIVQSTFLAWLSEYSADNASIGTGTFKASLQLPNAPGPQNGTIIDTAIQTELAMLDNQGQLSTSSNAVFFVFMPPATIIDPQSQSSNGSFSGYHNSFDNIGTHREIFYAVIPDPNQGAAERGLTPIDFTTVVASHELSEAITDPSSFNAAWYDDSLGEIGDICAWKLPPAHLELQGASYAVQREWSQKTKACVYQAGPLGLIACGQACVDPTGDPFNCGACGSPCNANQSCAFGSCVAAVTNPDPCGADLTSDPSNCGGCGFVCPSNTTCTNSNCVSCDFTVCDNVCIDTSGDLDNCNGCGNVCPSGNTCLQSSCEPCALTVCGEDCVDTTSDADNCDGCGNVCPSGTCTQSACQ